MQLRCAAVPVTRHGVREKGPHVPAPISPRHRSVRRLAAPLRGACLGRGPRGRPWRPDRLGVAGRCGRPRPCRRARPRRRHRPASFQHRPARGTARSTSPRSAWYRTRLVHRGRSSGSASHIRSVEERRAGLLRPCRTNSRIPTRARAHAPRADARESRRGRARFAASRRCRPRATSGTLRGSVRGGFRNRSRSAVRSGSGGCGSLSRVPAAPARCATGLGGRVRFRHEADRRCPGCSRHDSVRRPCHAGSLQDPGTRASRSRTGWDLGFDRPQAVRLRDPPTTRTPGAR